MIKMIGYTQFFFIMICSIVLFLHTVTFTDEAVHLFQYLLLFNTVSVCVVFWSDELVYENISKE